MEINFRTKEESNKIQQKEFLKLSPAERIYSFLDLMFKMKKFPTMHEKDISNNFLIVIEDEPTVGK